VGNWRRHSREFKRQAVARMRTSDNIHELARELKIERKLLCTWRYQLEGRPEKNHADYHGHPAPDTVELRLRRENKELKEALGEKAAEADCVASPPQPFLPASRWRPVTPRVFVSVLRLARDSGRQSSALRDRRDAAGSPPGLDADGQKLLADIDAGTSFDYSRDHPASFGWGLPASTRPSCSASRSSF